MCWLLTILPNIYGGRSVWSKANDDMAFATVSDKNEEPKNGNRKKRLHVSDARNSGTGKVNVRKNCLPIKVSRRQ